MEAKIPPSDDDASLVLGGQNLLTLAAYEEMHEFFNHTFNGIVTSKNKTYEDVCSNFIAEEKSVEDLVLEKLGKKTSKVGASNNRVSLRLF